MGWAVLFLTLAGGCGYLAADGGGWHPLLTWPAVAAGVMAAAYAGWGPWPVGKRADGTIRWASVVVLLPYFAYAWGVWAVRQAWTGEPAANEVAPGLWVGRWPTARTLPPEVIVVIDLAAEFPSAVRHHPGYVSVPTLDGTAPSAAAMAAAVARVESAGGTAYIHCAFGHGRSAAVAAAVIVRRGLAADVPAAEDLMRRTRPGIRLTRGQRRAATLAI